MNTETKVITGKTTFLMFLSMLFGFIFAWGSAILLVYHFFTMRR
jgi:hypothetical protein